MTSEALVRSAAAVLSVAGLWAAAGMFAKSRQAATGALTEPSVVERPEARLFFGLPNALFGLAYYALVLIAVTTESHALLVAAALGSIVALATSIHLAIALIRGHLECPRCWTAHAANALLCPLLIAAVGISVA